jgi:hypothetical protein
MQTPSDRWKHLYPRDQANWDDASEYAQTYLPIIAGILLSALVSLVLALSNPGRFQFGVYSLGRILSTFTLITIPAMILAGLWLMRKAAAGYFAGLYNPPKGVNIEGLINLRLRGVIPLPPPLDNFNHYPIVIVEDARIKDELDHTRWLGGPALLVIYDGNAVYLNRGSSFSRVLGPGIYFLEKYETIYDIVDLRQQTYTDSVKAWTKDGIHITFKVQFTCRIGEANSVPLVREIEPSGHNRDQERTLENAPIFPCDPVSVRKAVEWTKVKRKIGTPEVLYESKWLNGVWGKVQGSISNYVSQHRLDELFVASRLNTSGQILSESERSAILQRLSLDLSNDAGVNLTDLQIKDFNLGEDISKKRITKWLTEWIAQEDILKAMAEADLSKAVEEAQAIAQHDLIIQIANGLSEASGGTFSESVLLSLSRVIDQSMGDPYTQTYAAQSTLEAIEKIQELLKS